MGVQRLEREVVETLAEVFDHLLGLALTAGIDGKPAVLRVDPDLGLAPPGEGTRHQFLGDPFLQFAQLLAAGKVAVFDRQGQQPLLGQGMNQTAVGTRRYPAATVRLMAGATAKAAPGELFVEAGEVDRPRRRQAIELQVLEPHKFASMKSAARLQRASEPSCCASARSVRMMWATIQFSR